jgi:hypothetical protein
MDLKQKGDAMLLNGAGRVLIKKQKIIIQLENNLHVCHFNHH